MRRTGVLLTLLGAVVVPVRASAQRTAADSSAITQAVARSLLLELRSGSDHGGPAFLHARDSLGAIWVANVTPIIRHEAPQLLLDSATHNGLRFTLSSVVVTRDTVRVNGTFSKCVALEALLNHWNHSVTFEIPRRQGQWQPARASIGLFADGHCPPREH